MASQINFSISITIVNTKPQFGFWNVPLPNAVTFNGLRCTFSIEKSLKKHPNPCSMEIYNLSEATRAMLQRDNLLVEVLAGYDGELSKIFTGDVLYSNSVRNGADWVTKLQLGDGLRAYNYARINRSYPAGTPYKTLVADIANSMNLGLPLFSANAQTQLAKQIPAGTSLHGPAASELSRVLQPLGLDWSIQDGNLVMLLSNDVRSGDAVEINEDNGMIGSPAYGNPDRNGRSPLLTVECLPRPQVKVGGLIQVTSRDIHGGTFRVEKVHHVGDTWGDGRKSTIEARAV